MLNMRMRVVRLGISLAFLASQAAVLAPSRECVCDPDSGAAMTANAPGRQMPAMPMPRPGHQAPCSHPMLPGACNTVGCATTAIAAPGRAMPIAAAAPTVATAWMVEPPRGSPRGPEPPPPRA